MSVLEGLGAAVVLLVVAAATWMNYVALGHMLKDFRKRWPKPPAKRKRTGDDHDDHSPGLRGQRGLGDRRSLGHMDDHRLVGAPAASRLSVVSAAPLALHPKISWGPASGGT